MRDSAHFRGKENLTGETPWLATEAHRVLDFQQHHHNPETANPFKEVIHNRQSRRRLSLALGFQHRTEWHSGDPLISNVNNVMTTLWNLIPTLQTQILHTAMMNGAAKMKATSRVTMAPRTSYENTPSSLLEEQATMLRVSKQERESTMLRRANVQLLRELSKSDAGR
jgi:hypothetical protein